MSIASRHFQYSIGWNGFTPCDASCHISTIDSGMYEGAISVTSKIKLPVTVSVIFVEKLTLIVANCWSPSLKFSKLINAYQYIAWPVSDFAGKVITKQAIQAASGLATGTTEVVVADNVQLAELPNGSEVLSDLNHPVNVYQFLTTLSKGVVADGHILQYKGTNYRIFDIKRFLDVWVISCTLG